MAADVRQFRLIAADESRTAPVEAPSRTVEGLLRSLRQPGRICEISGALSSGKSTLALRLCLSALRDGRAAAWIDPTGTFWPLAALERYGSLDQLLVVKVADGAQALRAADVLLSATGAVAVVVVHLPANQRPTDGQLFRLQRLAEKSSATLVLLDERSEHATSLSPSVALRIGSHRATAANDGWVVQLRIHHSKHGQNGMIDDGLSHAPERLALAQTF
jgi:hypothetical protein